MSSNGNGKKRSYSDREKAMFLLALEANDGNLLRTARETGVPIMTLSDWRNGAAVNADVTDIRNEQRGTLADEFEALTWQALQLAKGKADKASYRELVTGAAIGADKQQLLRGKATQIIDDSGRVDAAVARVMQITGCDLVIAQEAVRAQPEFKELGRID